MLLKPPTQAVPGQSSLQSPIRYLLRLLVPLRLSQLCLPHETGMTSLIQTLIQLVLDLNLPKRPGLLFLRKANRDETSGDRTSPTSHLHLDLHLTNSRETFRLKNPVMA